MSSPTRTYFLYDAYNAVSRLNKAGDVISNDEYNLVQPAGVEWIGCCEER